MKINVSYPATGCQKLFEVDDEKKLRSFYEKRMGHEVEADYLGDEWKGYVLRIAGGNDKQGFPMKQGVLTNNRVRLLLSKGQSCYRPRRTGERKRKSVRGCIVDSNLSVLALVVIKKGQNEIPGLTDKVVPRRLGPKRASKIRKLFCLEKKDDVRRYVIKRPLSGKDGKKPKSQAPKIQRLITPSVLLHRRHKTAVKRLRREKNKELKGDYAKLLATRQKEAREKKREEIRRRRSSMRESKSSAASAPTEDTKKYKPISYSKKNMEKAALAAKSKKITKGGKSASVKATIKQAGGATAKAATATAKAAAKTAAKSTSKPLVKKDVKQLTKTKTVVAGKAAPQKAAVPKPAAAKSAPPKAAPAKKTAPSKAAPEKKAAAPKAAPEKKAAAPKPAPAKQAAAPKPAPSKPAAAPKAAASGPAKKPSAPKPAGGAKPAAGGAKPKAKPQKK